MGIAVSYHDTVTKLQGLERFARGPFDRTNWFGLLCNAADAPLVVVAEDETEMVAMPLMQTRHGLHSLTNWFSFTWRPLGGTGPAQSNLLEAIAADLRAHANRVVLSPLPDEDGTASRLETAFRERGWLVFREVCDENHILPVQNRDFAEYWTNRPGKMRTTLKRKAKNVDVEILTRFDDFAWHDYQAVYAESWKPEEERSDVLELFARAEGESGRIRLGIARAGGVPVAAQFWTVDGGTAYIHKLAHTQSASNLSAGTTLSAALFEHVIDIDRVDLVDFGTGTDAYKRDWMEDVRLRYRLTCLNWRKPKSWPAIVKAVARRLAPRHGPR
ncbi:GNAT family N-acetyltransferase [Qipengyuania zhejiangensis]|uniref:GNAT family N-acetyltransferase n=1 Tax=Qipengyuania zhejiangensis TaxID=3077782 RepID=UPI002D784A3C|nr:GNAT family N-acetyltransferase [Qipengyuania sp. Z2]